MASNAAFESYIKSQSGNVAIPNTPSNLPRNTARQSVSAITPRGKYFSGGGWQKFGDVLSTGQYALAGGARATNKQYNSARIFNKDYWKDLGSGAKSGIQNRASFEDLLADQGMQPGGKRMAAGLAADIFLDPLNLLSGAAATKALKKIPGISKTGQIIGSKVKTPLASKIINSKFGRLLPADITNPELLKKWQETQSLTRASHAKILNLVRGASEGLGTAEKRAIGFALENPEGGFKVANLPGAASDTEKAFAKGLPGVNLTEKQKQYQQLLGGLTPELQKRIEPLKQFTSDLGQQLVDAGLIPKESFAKYGGRYMPHVWMESLDNALVRKGGNKGFSGKFFKQRTGAGGFMREFDLPMASGLGTSSKDLELAKFYKWAADNYGVKKALNPENISELANKGYQEVKGLSEAKGGKIFNKTLMPRNVINFLQGAEQVSSNTLKGYDKVLNFWKKGKTIWNIPYHIRNVISNQILSEMSTGDATSQLPRAIKSFMNYMGKGDTKAAQELIDAGIIKKEALEEFTRKLTNEYAGRVGQKTSKFGKVDAFARKAQNVSEDTAKLNVYQTWRAKGLSEKDALAKAEEAIFSPYRISPSERTTIGRVAPFYAFSRQAAPFFAKTAYENPQRISKYYKAERMMRRKGEREGYPPDEKLQDWQKDLVPAGKDRFGRARMLQQQYIYPWGQFLEGGISTPGKTLTLPFGLGLNPLATTALEQWAGKDAYLGMEMKTPKDRAKQIAKTWTPTLPWNIGAKMIPTALTGADVYGKERTLPETVASDIFAVKTYPYEKAKNERSIKYQKTNPIYEQRDKIKSLMRQKTEAVTEKAKAHYDKQIKREQQRLQELMTQPQ